MDVSIIGSGNVATVLGKLIIKAGHTITEVTSKNIAHAQALAKELNAKANDNISCLSKHADIYLIAVSDNAIEEVCKQIILNDKIAVHTSGAISKDVLQHVSSFYGVLYPLQSLRKDATHNPIIPLLIDANSNAVKQQLKTFASTMSELVYEADDESRLKLHAAAVVVSNFTNHLFALTKEFCDKEKVDFNLLIHMIQEVAARVALYNPAEMQTGPAARKDEQTIQKHLQVLDAYPQLKIIYEVMSKSIQDFQS